MLILYLYREKDREKNGDAYKNGRRDLSDTAKKKKITNELGGTEVILN